MSVPRLVCALAGLGMGLLFYVAHRSDHTLSNRLLNYFCGPSAYLQLKHALWQWLPLPGVLAGCLPSALWCFIATSLCGGWKIRVGRERVIQLAWCCPLINAGWEFVQWMRWTDGRADGLDVAAGFVGWLTAHALFFRSTRTGEEIPALWNWRVGVFVTGFACMGLADVWR